MNYVHAAGAALLMALVGGLSEDAWAADFEEEPVTYSSWRGFYLGAHIGTGEVDVNGSYLAGDVEFGLEPTDPFFGVQAGYNWQIDQIVIGIEGDVSLAEWDDEKGPNANDQFISADLDWLITLRGRVGYAIDQLLVFATAGAAWANGEFTGKEDFIADRESNKNFEDIGLVAGGGMEWAWNDRWSVKLEGLWINFDESVDITTLTANSDPSDRADFDDAWLVWGAVNFHFGSP
jgi:outer membrane immunogenic protein